MRWMQESPGLEICKIIYKEFFHTYNLVSIHEVESFYIVQIQVANRSNGYGEGKFALYL